MNKITQIRCEYLSPNKTVETLYISNERKKQIIYVYNFKGNSFRLFLNRTQINNFFLGLESNYKNFENEDRLDKALERINIPAS